MHYTDLDVWQQAVDLAIEVYTATSRLPREERFGLTAQMRRAAVSVPSNIAEGEGRRWRRDHARFVLQARGSLFELNTQIVICERLVYLDCDTAAALTHRIARVGELINGTLRYLSQAANREPRTAPRSP
jgi:four helix bundle protein